MPKLKVYLTETEAEVLSIFVKRRILSDKRIAADLEALAEKLRAEIDPSKRLGI